MPAQVTKTYQSNAGTNHLLSLTPDYAAAVGSDPTGGTPSKIKAKITKGNREFGIRPRGVRLSRTIGTAPDTFKKYAFLPVLTEADWNSATFADGATITVGAIDYVIVASIPEDY